MTKKEFDVMVFDQDGKGHPIASGYQEDDHLVIDEIRFPIIRDENFSENK